jgi:serine/threonine-protein kinase
VAPQAPDSTQFATRVEGSAEPGVPAVGDVVAGKYRVDRIIGVGGMGVVVAATHLQIHEKYAIKVLLPKLAKDAETVERFLREARAAVRIKSEHIARVTDVGRGDGGAPYIVMEYLEGRDLGDLLAEHGPLPVTDAIEYVLQACEGIAEAHALGIVHRDLKPSNLFLTRRSDGVPFVKVLDFGISKSSSEQLGGPESPVLTDTKAVFGSPAYMSPEQIRSAKSVDVRSDVWTLGVVLHELLTGRTPFVAETVGGLLSAIAADEPERLSALRPDASPDLEAVILRCLAKKPAERFASVAELAGALAEWKSDDSIASIGRIQRVTGPVQLLSPPGSERARERADAPFGRTDAPVSTGARQPRGVAFGRVAAFAALVVLVGAGTYVLGRSYATRGAGSAASAGPASAEAAAASPPPALPSSDPGAAAIAEPPPSAGSASAEPGAPATSGTSGTSGTPASPAADSAAVATTPAASSGEPARAASTSRAPRAPNAPRVVHRPRSSHPSRANGRPHASAAPADTSLNPPAGPRVDPTAESH